MAARDERTSERFTELWLGRVAYRTALALQDRVAGERLAGLRGDALLLLEHPPTITLGRRAGAGDVLLGEAELARRGVEVVRVGRGGQATYHGPGQLVGYPIARLPRGGRSVRTFVASLEAGLIRAAGSLGVRAERHEGHPGIWVGARKLASIGLEIRRGITRHGFALNVAMDLTNFQAIVPCGVPGLVLTDLSREAGTRITLEDARRAVGRAFDADLGAIDLRSEPNTLAAPELAARNPTNP